ncbi:MAG TPA: DUF5658 family protein [Candidatus Binatia bacterium]
MSAWLPAVWPHFIFNLLLQVFDGVLTYQVVVLGVPEANPLVRASIVEWGLVWGLVYWKALACALLFLIFSMSYRRQRLALNALTLTAAVYGTVSFIGLCAMLLQFG